jgi:hypothetical protein
MTFLLTTLLAAAAVAGPSAASTIDDQARFLAGLATSAGSPLAPLESTPRWRVHARAMDEDWARLSSRLSSMDGWAARELRPRLAAGRPVLYLFAGPDVVTPITLYPDAPAYVLTGLEPVGRAPPPETLPPGAVADALDGLHGALRSLIPASFFRTDEMGHDLRGKAIDGVQPIVYLFLARSGARVLSAERIELDALGFARTLAEGDAWGEGLPGLRVRFVRPGRREQELVYVRLDLGNAALARRPGFDAFVARLGPSHALLKAASFILHDGRFSRARDLLLAAADSVLQDDSGVPLRAFKKGEWTFAPYGTYLPPKPPFQRAWQPELARLFAEPHPASLPFTFGYRHGAAETNLLFAVKRAPADAGGAQPHP